MKRQFQGRSAERAVGQRLRRMSRPGRMGLRRFRHRRVRPRRIAWAGRPPARCRRTSCSTRSSGRCTREAGRPGSPGSTTATEASSTVVDPIPSGWPRRAWSPCGQRGRLVRQRTGRDHQRLYKAEVIHRKSSWRTRDEVEWARSIGSTGSTTADCFEPIGNIPPGRSRSQLLFATQRVRARRRDSNRESPGNPGRFKTVFAILEKLGLSSNSALPGSFMGQICMLCIFAVQFGTKLSHQIN